MRQRECLEAPLTATLCSCCSFAELSVGRLDLSYNQLVSLPSSFGSLEVKGNLDLSDNRITSLPESFGSLRVGGRVDLRNNAVREERGADTKQFPNISAVFSNSAFSSANTY